MKICLAKMQGLDWSDLIFVLAVARSRTLAAASRNLGVNESTVARRIARIERQLNAKLFERYSGILTATNAGETSIASAERIELETQNLEAAIAGTDFRAAGTVRITCVPVILNHLLIPSLATFLQLHPQLHLELIADPRDLSLTRREADIAIRLARPTKEARIFAHRIGQLDYAVFGKSGCQSESLPWVTYEEGMRDLPQAKWIADKNKKNHKHSTIMVNDAESILACVKQGLGKSLLPIFVGEKESSIERYNKDTAISRQIWLMVHPELRNFTRVKIVMQWLKRLVRQI